jgi:transposase
MATVLEECITEEQRSAVSFLWAKGLNVKDIHKEIFPVYGGKCLSRKSVHNWLKKFSEGRSKFADDARQDAEVAETTAKILLRCGFRRADKAMGHVYQCWWRIRREINVFFSRFEYIIYFTFYIHLWPIY